MRRAIRLFIHQIAHILQWNEGRIEDWADGDRWMMGFRCDGCGKLLQVFEMGKPQPAEQDASP